MIRDRGRKSLLGLLLAHPFELAFAALFILVGGALAAKGHEVRLSSVQELPMALVVGWEVCLLLGGPAIAVGLCWRGSELMARAIERAGLYLAAAAWSTYALTIGVMTHGNAAVPVGQAVAIALACLLRAYALSRVDRSVVKARQEDVD